MRAPADNTPLRGQTAMSVYVSVYGTSEVNAAEIRLSIEEQFRQLGINVLPHTAPPGFPVFNLTIKEVGSSSHLATSTDTRFHQTMWDSRSKPRPVTIVHGHLRNVGRVAQACPWHNHGK